LIIDPALWTEAAERADERLPTDPWQDLLAAVETMDSANVERVGNEIRVASEFLLHQVLGINRAQVRVSDSRAGA
jgi:hypothetical protein